MRSLVGRVSLVGWLGVTLSFTSCATIPPICEPQNARQAGIDQAMHGEDFHPAVGVVCIDQHRSIFRQSFEAGYQEGKQTYCDPNRVEKQAETQGLDGRKPSFDDKAHLICENISDLHIAFTVGLKRGLASFCAEDQVESAATLVGEKGAPSDFSDTKYQNCGSGKLKHLASAYRKGYKTGLEQFCHAPNAPEQGLQDGTEGKDPEEVTAKYQQCPATHRRDIASAYQGGYEKGLGQFCQSSHVLQEANTNAQNSATATFPERFTKCLRRYPQLKAEYQTAFNSARSQAIATYCTFDNGSLTGRNDAGTSAQKKTTMPSFCDANLFSVYLNGYLEGWRQEKERLCNSGEAFQRGIEDGRRGTYARYTAPALCPAEFESALQQKYQEGYQSGRSQTPTTVYAGGGSLIPGSPYPPSALPGNYSPVVAREACLQEGYSLVRCQTVTSVVCIQQHYQPELCQIANPYVAAVDKCLQRGYSPATCGSVKDASCVESSASPSSCQSAPLVPWR